MPFSWPNRFGAAEYLVILLFGASLSLHLAFVRPNVDEIFVGRDAGEYLAYASNLVHKGVYSKSDPAGEPRPDSYRSPGYPLFLSAVLLTAGDAAALKIVIYIQTLLSATLVLLTYFAGRFMLSPFGAAAAAALVAFSPHLVAMSNCVLSETLFAFMLLTALFFFQAALKSHSKMDFAVSGILFGYAYWVNEACLFLPVLLSMVALIRARLKKNEALSGPVLPGLLLMLGLFSLFPLSWNVRNAVSLPANAPRAGDRAAVTMSHGAYPGFIYKSPQYKRFPYREDPDQPEFGASFESFFHILWERSKAQPGRYLTWYLAGKPYYLWSWDIIQGVGDVYVYPVRSSLYQSSAFAAVTRGVMRALHPAVVALALIGVLLGLKALWDVRTGRSSDRSPIFVISVCCYFTLIYMVFAPWPRYSIPLRPELYLTAAWVVERLVRSYQEIGGNRRA